MKSDNFEWLLPSPVQGESWRWGRYVGPLQVEFSPGTITWVTESLVNAEVGQRVLVRFYSGTRATIMGVLGGIGQDGLEELSTQNLNDVTRGGFYRQSASANATFTRNYPATVAGLLEVFESGNMIWQRYTLYNSSGNASGVYNRRRYNGTWYAWEQLQIVGNPGEIVINGTAYATSGTAPVPSFTWDFSQSPVHVATVSMPVPFTPPAGWTFAWNILGTSGFTFASTAGREPTNGRQEVRILQIANTHTGRISLLAWHLTKL